MSTATVPAEAADQASALPPAIQLAMMTGGFRLSRALYVVAKLGVADLLRDGLLTCGELAARCDAHGPSLYRVMRALASVGVFSEDEQGRFGLTSGGSMLRSDVADTVLPTAIAIGEEWHWRLWGNLFYSVKTGQAAWNHLFGMHFTESCANDKEMERLVIASRTAIYGPSDDAIVEAYDFSPYRSIVDVGLGSGYGGLLTKILEKHPALTGVLYNLPAVLADAAAWIREQGLEERCRLVEGDCQQQVSVRGDVYLLKGVLHDLVDEAAIAVLRRCREALAEGGKLLVCELMMPPGNDFFVGKLIDLESLLLTPGARERTEEEFRTIITAAGLWVARVMSTTAPISVIEAVTS